MSIDEARKQAQNLHNFQTSANGVIANNKNHISHHIRIVGNVVHDAPGAGIATCYADYVTIVRNETYRNAFWSPYGSSGISIYESRDIDHETGYKNIVFANVSHHNREFIPFYMAGTITDGNGIIIDDNKNTQSNKILYGGRTYVAENIVYMNGGSGIHAYSSQHVDIVHNTAYLNNQEPMLEHGQIFSRPGSDVNIMNNILYSALGKPIVWTRDNIGTATYDYNVLFNGTSESGPHGPHDIYADPGFVSPETGDFSLRPDSPAVGSGIPNLASIQDVDGNSYSVPNGGRNRGAGSIR